MVIGDPYVIAVIFENIREWNGDKNYTNGLLAFSMDGILFPGEALNATLRPELKKLSTKLEAIPQNDELYGLEKSICFAKLYEMIYPSDWDEEEKTEYNISKNDSLYILKADLIIEKIRKVEYEIYFPLLSNNLTQLNLSVCKDTKIDISIPFEIPIGQIDKYNKSSKLYNSICVTSTSEDGTDEPYKDRQDNYKKNNSLKVCEEDCDFIDYDFKNQKAVCSCFKKLNIPAI